MDLQQINDSEVMMLINEGSEEAKELIFEKHKDVIDILIKKYNLILYKLNIEIAEAYAEASYGFTDAINCYADNKSASFRTFLTLCIKRRLVKLFRKHNTEKNKMYAEAYSLDYMHDQMGIPLIEVIKDRDNSDPLLKTIDDESFAVLTSQIKEELSAFEYDVYEFMIEGFNYKEIADILSRNHKQVDNAMQRIKEKVKGIITSSTCNLD